MNVFVLTTGRTGSLSFERACSHIENYTAAHESRCQLLGDERLNFADNHIEIDNRLSWFLGRLGEKYGDNAIYIHLLRDEKKVAASYKKRWNRETSIVRAYAYGILKNQEHHIDDPYNICLDYAENVNTNIRDFLKDKSKTMTFHLENLDKDFKKFWELIDAKGNYEAALEDFKSTHNYTGSDSSDYSLINKTLRVIKKLPSFIRNA
ncbi:hypothetical protein [Fulvivirga aurantia]|uniref:hypothetical protein n=1 Tax=Fulvivirga aurantia TaxID=2529383 RepID=UPI00162A64B6|nr:hypothetical protein [Fulvivirga aurantia]